jgi:hypothetical protein
VPPTRCWLEILAATSDCLTELQPEQVAALARDVAQLQPSARPPNPWLFSLQIGTRDLVLQMEPAQQVDVLASFAMLDYCPMIAWGTGLAQALSLGMDRLQPSELASLMSSAGRLELNVDEDWMQQLVQQLEETCLKPFQQQQAGQARQADGAADAAGGDGSSDGELLTPGELRDIITGLHCWRTSEESHELELSFLAALQQAAVAQGLELPVDGLVQLLYLQAVNGFSPEPEWLAVAQQQVHRQLQLLGKEDALSLLVALAVWAPPVLPELLQSLLLLSQHLLPSLAPQQCASALTCLLRLGAQPPQEWLSTLGSAVGRRQEDLTPDVAQVRAAWCCAHGLGHKACVCSSTSRCRANAFGTYVLQAPCA